MKLILSLFLILLPNLASAETSMTPSIAPSPRSSVSPEVAPAPRPIPIETPFQYAHRFICKVTCSIPQKNAEFYLTYSNLGYMDCKNEIGAPCKLMNGQYSSEFVKDGIGTVTKTEYYHAIEVGEP